MTALRAPQIAVLAADTGPLQMSLFDEQNFAEISHPDYPAERLIACRNPALAELRARKRAELLDATGAALAPIQAASPRAGWPAPTGSGCASGRCWAGTRWPNTSTSRSPIRP